MFDYNNFELREELKKLKVIDIQERGQDINYLVNYTRKKFGDKGVEKVLSALRDSGFEMPDISKVDNMEWLSAQIPTAYMLAMVKVFNWEKNDVVEMGRALSSFSQTIKLFIRYFSNLEKTLRRMAPAFNKHYTKAQAEIVMLSTNNKTAVIKFTNFVKHPVTCDYFLGVISNLVETALGNKRVEIEETKCNFRGDDYHEYTVKW